MILGTAAAAITTLMVGFTTALGLYAIYVQSSETRRRSFSQGPLGLRHRAGRRVRAHSIARISEGGGCSDKSNASASASAWTAWLAGVSRQRRRVLEARIDETFALNNVRVESLPAAELSYRHFEVLLAHQKRVYGSIAAYAVASMRFLVARCMTGTIDEYAIPDSVQSVHSSCCDGSSSDTATISAAATATTVDTTTATSTYTVIAWSHTVIKGNTLRGMWFYQRPQKLRIWFHALRTAVARAAAQEDVQWVDLGPSADERVTSVKDAYGFESTLEWAEQCDYSGPWKSVMPVQDVPRLWSK